jgi:hypothetical protein
MGAIMERPSTPGEGPAFPVVTAGDNPAARPLPDQSPPRKAATARPPREERIPVARPAPPRPKLNDDPGEIPQAELLEPNAIKGWSVSLGVHALLLLVMALWYFVPLVNEPTTFEGKMAGSEFGDESGTELKGGLGLELPMSLPGPEPTQVAEAPVITSLPASELKLDAPTIPRPTGTPRASNGGGVALSNGMGAGDGFGVARFGNGGENINGVQVKVGDPQFTLIWDSKADLDIHVLEPGGSHIYWEERNGEKGGELDVDDIDGYGPENINWGGGTGQGPPGDYKWYVHYYGARDGLSVPTQWKVRIKHDGKVTIYKGKLSSIGEKSSTRTLHVDPPSKSEGSKDAAPPKDGVAEKVGG